MHSIYKYLVILLLQIVLFTSCNNTNNTIGYCAPSFPKQSNLEVSSLNADYPFRYAYRTLIYDSLLIVATLNEENHIAVFNRHSGDLIKEFGKKGDAPDDLITPTEYSIDCLTGNLYINDYGLQSVVCYDLNRINDEDFSTYKKIKFSHSFKGLNSILHLKDTLFISPNYSSRFLIASPKCIINDIHSPIGDEHKFSNEIEWNLFMKDYACHTVSPDGNHWASGTFFGGILEIFGKDYDTTKYLGIKRFYEPIFNKNEHLYVENEETIGGFSYLNATDKYIYATVFGTTSPQTFPTQIWKLDWDGTPIEVLHSNGFPIDCFSVCEEEGIIYAITTNEDGEQSIIKMTIK